MNPLSPPLSGRKRSASSTSSGNNRVAPIFSDMRSARGPRRSNQIFWHYMFSWKTNMHMYVRQKLVCTGRLEVMLLRVCAICNDVCHYVIGLYAAERFILCNALFVKEFLVSLMFKWFCPIAWCNHLHRHIIRFIFNDDTFPFSYRPSIISPFVRYDVVP